MLVRVRMVDSHREFLARQVVAEDKVEFKVLTAAARDGSDGVVRYVNRESNNAVFLVGITRPSDTDVLGELNESRLRLRAQTEDRHRPVDKSRFDLGEFFKFNGDDDLRALHREGVATALHVVVREDRAANDGKIGIRADKVVRQRGDEIKLTRKSFAADLHRHVILRKRDAVLVVVNVGRILQIPLVAAKGEGDLAQILSRGRVCVTRVADVLGAKQTFRITRLRRKLRRRDGLRVFFGFGKVDRNVDLAVFRIDRPTAVLCDSVGAYVVRVDRKAVEIVARRLRIVLVKLEEFRSDLARTGHQDSHQLGVKEIVRGNSFINYIISRRIFANSVKNFVELEILFLVGNKILESRDVKLCAKKICGVNAVSGVEHTAIFCVIK